MRDHRRLTRTPLALARSACCVALAFGAGSDPVAAQDPGTRVRLQTRDELRSGEISLRGINADGDYRSDLGLYSDDVAGARKVDPQALREHTLALYRGAEVPRLPDVIPPHRERAHAVPPPARTAAPSPRPGRGFPIGWVTLAALAVGGLVGVRLLGPGSRPQAPRVDAPTPVPVKSTTVRPAEVRPDLRLFPGKRP